jgi:hypothetical protein
MVADAVMVVGMGAIAEMEVMGVVGVAILHGLRQVFGHIFQVNLGTVT